MHSIVKCSCGRVLLQCRCYAPDKPVVISPEPCPHAGVAQNVDVPDEEVARLKDEWADRLDTAPGQLSMMENVHDGRVDLLTDTEHRAMDLTVELVQVMVTEVIGQDASRDGDVAELVGHVHAIQHMIMSQAAARAYPDRYRLLGEVLR